MTRDEAKTLLRTRSAFTSQPYSDDVVDDWYEALADWDFKQARTALVIAARAEKRITVAHVVDRLPQRSRAPEAPPAYCGLCDGTGWVQAMQFEAHNPKVCTPTEARPCLCTASKPCRCTAGQAAADVHRRILEHNAHTRRSLHIDQGGDAPPAQWRPTMPAAAAEPFPLEEF